MSNNAIIEYLTGTNEHNRLMALLEIARTKNVTPSIISLIKLQKDNDFKLFGNPIKSFALATLHLIGVEEYTGDDLLVKDLIECKMNFK